MARVGNGPATPHHFSIDVELADLANRNGAPVTVRFNRAAGNLLSLHQSLQRIRRLLAAGIFRVVLVPATLAIFRGVNSVKADIRVALA
jgi:hypothetical protein